MAQMKLITKEIERLLLEHPLYKHENDAPENVQVLVKFFTPWAGWTWYVTEARRVNVGDDVETPTGNDWLFFGFTRGHDNELGYFRLSELLSIRGPAGLTIERDMYFGKHTLAEAQARQI